MLIGLLPASTKAATKNVSVDYLGYCGTVTCGSKTKSGKWWKMKVNGRSVFCMDLGNTCHNGDAYKSSSKTYSTADGGTSKQMASLAYWFDKTMKRSNRAYIMTQALVWWIENGGTSQAKLKDVIKAVKNNTGKFTSSVDNLYSQIFQPSEDIKAESTIWQYGGSGSKRQRLVDLKASTQPGESEPQEAHIHDTITYHQRINIFKVNDEDEPLKGAKFKIVADNIDELYSFTAYGKSNETGSMDDIGDHFEIAAETDADGMIVMRFTYKLQSENYYYSKNADSLTSEQKTALKKEWNREGYKYASDLSKEGAKTLMQTELDKEWQKIANKYTITEISSGSNNILVAPTYKNGKTLTLKTRDSWTAINGVWPESTLKEMWKYSQAVNERVTNTRKKASVRVIKQDADSKDGKARGEAALDGAIFKLYEDSKCTQRAEVTDASGKTTNGIYVVKNGQFDTDYMICGKDYWLKEEKAPKGYLLNTTPLKIRVDGKNDSSSSYTIAQTYKFSNKPIKNKVRIRKTAWDSESGTRVAEVGAKFQIYLTEKGSYDKCSDDERDVITIGESGEGDSKLLWYGNYTIHQISTGEFDSEMVDDFDVDIEEDTSKLSYYLFTKLDQMNKTYLRIVKKDKNTEKNLLKPGTTYKIYAVDDQGKETLVVQRDWENKKYSEFVTDETGTVTTYESFRSGKYRLYETAAPTGYTLNKDPIDVTIHSSLSKLYTDENGRTIRCVEVEQEDEEVYGKFGIKKSGEMLSGFEKGQFTFENQQLKNVVYEIRAAEDIQSQDGQGTKWFEKGDLACTITTGVGAEFTSDCAGITGYDLTEDGVVTVKLPLGKYTVKEKQTVDGYVLDDREYSIELKWKDDQTPVVIDSSGSTDTNGILSVVNNLARPKLSLVKKDSKTGKPVFGAKFGIYTKNDIVNASGEKIVAADDLVGMLYTDQEGNAVSETRYPIKGAGNTGEYYIKEVSVSGSYFLSDQVTDFTLEYAGQETPIIEKKIDVTNDQTEVQIDKLSVAGSKEINGCKLEVKDATNRVIYAWTSGDAESPTMISNAEALGYCNLSHTMTDKGSLIIRGLLAEEEYTLSETRPADGYATANSIVFRVADSNKVEVKQEDGTWQTKDNNHVIMLDDTIKIKVHKIADNTNNQLKGAKIQVIRKRDRKVVYEFASGENPALLTQKLVAGETYIFRELKAPDGYKIAEDVKLTVKDTSEIQEVFIVDKAELGKVVTNTPGTTPDGGEGISPETGYMELMLMLASVAGLSSCGLVVLACRKRKRKA